MRTTHESSGIPDEMVAARWEVKMVCEEVALPRVLAELRLHPLGLSTLHPDRIVQSIYLDTHEGDALSDNLAGISRRVKFRLRWYGPEVQSAVLTLERKRRQNQCGDKSQVQLPRPTVLAGAFRPDFMRAIIKQVPGAWQEAIVGLEPVQWIRYQRSYFTSGDRRIRITVDQALRATDLRNTMHLRFGWHTPLNPMLILECKADVANSEAVEEFVSSFPLRMDKCSKFVMASDPTHGPTISRGLP